MVNKLLTGERRSPSQPATPDANALPGQPALRPLAGGILGRHRSIARRPPARARPWSCARRANAGQGRAAHPALHEDKARSAAHVQEQQRSVSALNAVPPMVQMANGHCHTLITSTALDRAGRRAGYAGRNQFGWNKSLSSWLGDQIGGSNGSDNALPEMRKRNAPGSRPLRSHRPPMHKL